MRWCTFQIVSMNFCTYMFTCSCIYGILSNVVVASVRIDTCILTYAHTRTIADNASVKRELCTNVHTWWPAHNNKNRRMAAFEGSGRQRADVQAAQMPRYPIPCALHPAVGRLVYHCLGSGYRRVSHTLQWSQEACVWHRFIHGRDLWHRKSWVALTLTRTFALSLSFAMSLCRWCACMPVDKFMFATSFLRSLLPGFFSLTIFLHFIRRDGKAAAIFC